MALSRVTSTGGAQLMLANLQASYQTLVEVQDHLSSGKHLRRPSDSPAATLNALEYRSQLRRSKQFERNTTDAQSWLNVADSALTTTQSYLTRIRELALQGTNGSSDTKARAAVANEVRSIRESLIQLGNTKYGNRAIFSGTRDTQEAYNASGTYLGNSGSVLRPVASGVDVQVNATGEQVFGAAGDPGGNVFARIATLADDISNGNIEAAKAGIDRLDNSRDRISGVQATLGARANRVQDILTRNEDVTLEVKSLLSETEDVDIAKALVDLKVQEMGYQTALSVTAKVIQPSLLDFLR